MKNSLLFILLCSFAFCQPKKAREETASPAQKERFDNSHLAALGKLKLSDYGFFKGELSDLLPAERVFPYELNTPLFTDYAYKKRFIYIPENSKMQYHPKETFAFPEGAVLIKNFYYPLDFRKAEGPKRIIETRLLIKEKQQWRSLPYIWSEDQKEAYLEVTGGQTQVSWINGKGEQQQNQYLIPNLNQCKSCHIKGQSISPIGPKARHLNRKVKSDQGEHNQLAYWEKQSILTKLPKPSEWPANAVWNNAQYSTDDRALAYLDINCGHCHNPEGPAKTSALDLTVFAQSNLERGINKAPIAAGRGAGNLQYDIVPGHAEASILWYRMNSDDPGIMMPELGRNMIDQEGVALIKAWIDQMGAPKNNI
ncbi:SO2930 family diheme c-type cytochrome [Persicobacter sp. CCB-QB2]|uniref:SO2930 family diheme c-type cytochrome n=1 Tax=Persicobacter sp. CCB-QB2 TaxID=1561025 RepID=UPI0006A97C7E|nr:SO2930 family diheme c-type cytochrome [Persicobacter sp. CCB-QB2]